MPYLRHFTAMITIFTLVACHKSSSPPSNNTPPVTGSMKVNLVYPAEPAVQTPFELIISEPAGKQLLDTIASMNTPVVATLSTKDTLLDVTTITKYDTNYTVTTYRSINPSTLYNLVLNYFKLNTHVSNTNQTIAAICYTNIPANAIQYGNLQQTMLFTSFPYLDFNQAVFNPYTQTFQITYDKDGSIPAYFLLPAVGLYNLHTQVHAVDTVDCSKMDTAMNLTFDRPYPFTIYNESSSFFGLPDSTVLTNISSFTDELQSSAKPGVDFEYPNVPFQKYELTLYGVTGNNEGLYYYFYGNQPPHTLPFPTESDFSIASSQPSNFSVTFSSTDHTSYFTSWMGAFVVLNVFAPPGVNSFQPISWLTGQKSKLLKSTNYSDLLLKAFNLENTGMNYASYMAIVSGPDAAKKPTITSDASITKYFP